MLFPVVAATLIAGVALAQSSQTFRYAHLYDNGTLHLVIDPGDAGGANAALTAAIIIRRGGLTDRAAGKELPDWLGYSSPDFDYGNDQARIRYFAVGASPSRADSQVFNIPIMADSTLHYEFDVGYRLNLNGLKGPWFYAQGSRVTDPVADPTASLVSLSFSCVDGAVNVVYLVSAEPVMIRVEVYDSVDAEWVGLVNAAGGQWGQVTYGGLIVGRFYAPGGPFTTDGATRVYVMTKDGVEHGPVAGPTMDFSCGSITY